MIIASIHRNETDNKWIVLIRDTIKDSRLEIKADFLHEAEAKARKVAEERGQRFMLRPVLKVRI